MIQFDRAGAKALLKRPDMSKSRLARLLNLSRPWLDALIAGRDLYNQDRALLTNQRIRKLLEKQ